MRRDPFADDLRDRPMILPSILAADFAKLGEEIQDVDAAGADFLHLDVMDGRFVRNISFGPPVVKAVRGVTDAYLDAHLMIHEPERYGPELVQAGAGGISFHIELADNVVRTADSLYEACAATGANVGVVLNPATVAEAVNPVLDKVRTVLVMSVVPGFGGQAFTENVLPKVEAIKRRLRPDQRLAMDGGIDASTARRCRDAGCDWFIAGSAIFGQADRKRAVAALRAALP